MLTTPIDLSKKRSDFELFIRQQNATELLRRQDIIGYVSLDYDQAFSALANNDRQARIYCVYPTNGGEVRFSNKIELGLILLKLR